MDYVINLYKGRIGRKYLLLGLLFGLLLMGVASILVIFLFNEGALLWIFSIMIGLPCILFVFSLYVRRLHDMNMSGWYVLILQIPVVGLLMVIGLLFIRGNEKQNKYGEPPSEKIRFFNAIFNVDEKNY